MPTTCVLQLPDIPHPCPYRPGLVASYEHYLIEGEGPRTVENLLDHGFRAFGSYWFRPGGACCGACLPIRVPVATFRPSRSQKRAARRADAAGVTFHLGTPAFTEEKYALYREHKKRFADGETLGRDEFYAGFYGEDPAALETEYRRDGRLIGAGLVRATSHLLSSTYFYYGPEGARLSLGTCSILREIALARERGARHYHLGYFVPDNRSMRYKADFRPCEVQVGPEGTWTPLRDADGSWLADPAALLRRPAARLDAASPGAFEADAPVLFLPSMDLPDGGDDAPPAPAAGAPGAKHD